MNRKTFLLVGLVWLLLLPACTMPENLLPPTPGLPPQTATAEMVMPSATLPPVPSETPLAALPTAAPVLPSETPIPPATLTSEPTLSPTPIDFPVITFNTNANCRLGPSKNYNQKTNFLLNRTTTAEGRNPDGSWLWVKAIEGHCWINVSTVKDPIPFDFLPVITFTPLPEAPSRLTVSHIDCSGRISVTLRWPDVVGETGYNLYRDGITIIKLNADSFEYTDFPPQSETYFYEIESFNDVGLSTRYGQNVPGCKK